jgi:2-oxoglutarate ferredoxin oxidoreductase subunit beta
VSFAIACGATFVARVIDVDAHHMQEVLRRAHEHKGTAFIEITQNCPVFNDGVWSDLEDRKTRPDSALVLEQGQPLVFGPPGAQKGIKLQHGVPSIVTVEDGESATDKGVVVHDEHQASKSYAYALASLSLPDFPLPVGIIREVEASCYEDTLQAQVDHAIEKQGHGDLAALLHSGDTWEVR